ncbi:glutathione hydrolase 1 proenzyme-like [Condylostylus longicornis]|uniref:glutathione hydrolase 1 proenzyme-like n=1 Tax=Condylostylus longicornis TaxID=2530218 RepID=UPI00244E4241|nr:glutathione hydrolase 1 proenzyme-like [Condylostylus longicornis]
MKFGKISKKGVIFTAIGIVVIVAIVVALVFAYKTDSITERGAVVSNGYECSKIGISILSKGGSAADAAIATLFCEGVVLPQSMGLGGGFVATIYTKSEYEVESLIAREAAPLRSHKDMFENTTEITGGISVAVPGELRGYWALHKAHGKLPWADLIKPTINLARTGVRVSAYLAKSLEKYKSIIMDDRNNFREIFINEATGDVWKEGDIMKRLRLADTLEEIAEKGEGAIYGGEIGKMLVEDIESRGGIIQEKDLLDYSVRWEKPVKVAIDEQHTLYTVSVPGSGIILTFILNLIQSMRTDDRNVFHQRIVEAFKHGYGQRTKLGDPKYSPEALEIIKNLEDPEFVKEIRKKIFDNKTFTDYRYYGANFSNVEDHGTANLAVLAPNGDAVVVTSTVNTIFGAKFRSRTGIILNDEMDDFSVPGRVNGFGIPPSPANFIEKGKIPMSSMCPSIILDERGDVRLLIGAAGGSKITTAVALSIIRYFMLNQNLNDSIQGDRLHHQLAPNLIQFETNFDKEIFNFLNKTINHAVEIVPENIGFAAVTAIGNLHNEMSAVYDRRRKGSFEVMEINKSSE